MKCKFRTLINRRGSHCVPTKQINNLKDDKLTPTARRYCQQQPRGDGLHTTYIVYLTRLSFQNIILQNYSNTCDKYFLISLIPLFLLVRSTVFGRVENDQEKKPGLMNNALALSITQCRLLKRKYIQLTWPFL